MNAYENAYVVAIHSGFLSVPYGSDPDYRIPEGEILDNQLEAYNFGYPCGTINRHPFQGNIIQGRGEWIYYAKTISTEDAPVNILLTGVFDGNTHKLFLHVEGYYTMAVTEPSHWLNIVVTQSDIIGPQSGIGGGTNYVHNHMLRSFITPMNEEVWGEEIVAPAQGNYFEFDYEYVLPTTVNGVVMKPENIDIIAFVCAEKTEVLNVTGIKPSYINYEKPLNATLLNPERNIAIRYGFNFFETKLKNLSNQTVSSAKFEVIINDERQEVEWTGEISSFQTQPISIMVEPYEILDASNKYAIKLIALNDEPIDGNTLSGSFFAPLETTEKIFIEIKTDKHADENRFVIKDIDGNIVAEFGPYEENLVAVYNETITLNKNETYCFEVTDQCWNGIQDPRGYYKLRNDNGELIYQAFDITLFGDRVFIYTSLEPSGINETPLYDAFVFYNALQQTIEISFATEVAGKMELSLYTVTGTLLVDKKISVVAGENGKISLPVSKYPKGVYLLKIDNGKQFLTSKLLIY